jgi:hypothetical protein
MADTPRVFSCGKCRKKSKKDPLGDVPILKLGDPARLGILPPVL